jgi:hypothetical protein
MADNAEVIPHRFPEMDQRELPTCIECDMRIDGHGVSGLECLIIEWESEGGGISGKQAENAPANYII